MKSCTIKYWRFFYLAVGAWNGVAVLRHGSVVGHIPRRISAACSLFIERNGRIHCRITGPRQYSADLPQGGLEIPCVLTNIAGF